MKINQFLSLIFFTFSSVNGFINNPTKSSSITIRQNKKLTYNFKGFANLIEGLDEDEEDVCDTEIVEDKNIPIRVMDKKIEDFNIKVYEPYGIEKKNTESILFFTGGNSIIPGEIYSNFLNNLASKNYAVYVAINDMDKSETVAEYLLENYKNLNIVGHSTGSINALKLCNELKDIKKCIFMDPVDNRFVDSNEDSKKNLQSKSLANVLFLNAKRSYEWTYTPFPNVPFIPAFRIKEKDLNLKNGVTLTVEAKDYGHCDILDATWGNLMHSTISKGVDDRDVEVIDNYQKWCATTIDSFFKNEEFKKSTMKDFSKSKEFKNIKYNFDV